MKRAEKQRVSYSLPTGLVEELREYALKEGMDMSTVINIALKKYLRGVRGDK